MHREDATAADGWRAYRINALEIHLRCEGA